MENRELTEVKFAQMHKVDAILTSRLLGKEEEVITIYLDEIVSNPRKSVTHVFGRKSSQPTRITLYFNSGIISASYSAWTSLFA